MIVRVGDRTECGRAVDLVADVGPDDVAAAVRTGRATADGTEIEVYARDPGPLHERVGAVGPSPSIRPRTALALAARSRGWSTPVDARLAAARERLDAVDVDGADVDLAASRRRVAEATAETEAARERVATARGRLLAEAGDDATDGAAADRLAAAVRELSEVETAAVAARETHGSARTSVRRTRERLRERLRVADEVGNLERRARARLVEHARPAYRAALAAVPGHSIAADPFDTDPDAMALAVARVAHLRAPVVLACDRFPDARSAARWLRAPAIRLEP